MRALAVFHPERRVLDFCPHIGQVSPTRSFAQVANSEPRTVRSLIGTDRFHMDPVTESFVVVTEF